MLGCNRMQLRPENAEHVATAKLWRHLLDVRRNCRVVTSSAIVPSLKLQVFLYLLFKTILYPIPKYTRCLIFDLFG